MQDGFLQIHYSNSFAAVKTENTGTPNELHLPVVLSAPELGLSEVAPQVFREFTGKSGLGRRLAGAFQRLAHEVTVDSGDRIQQLMLDDFRDQVYIVSAVRALLGVIAPEYSPPDQIEFDLVAAGDEFRVHTNIDFVEANVSHHRHYSIDVSTITPAFLLSHIASVRDQLEFAASFGSELATTSANSAVMRTKFEEIVERRRSNDEILAKFQDRVIRHGNALREAINSGARDLRDFIPILYEAQKFKTWLGRQEDPSELLVQYYEDLAQRTWISSLPAKLFRWAVVVGVGVLTPQPAGTFAAGTLAAADTFLVERLMGGWRPSRFVESSLEPFTRRQ